MSLSWSGKVVLITGAAGGFGKAFADKLLSLGCKVCLGDINTEAGEKTAQDFASKYGNDSVKFTLCDVTSDSSFKEAFGNCKDEFGSIDILVNNAGVGNEKNFKFTLDVNLGGTIRGTELALDLMSKAKGQNGGRVVNIASIAGLKTIPFGPFYGASKSGIVHYTRAVGHPFHASYTGVTVQCLCPSLVDTPFIQVDPSSMYNPQSAAAVKSLTGKIPLLEPSEIADALVTLLEEGKPGGVMALEKGKPPYYVDASIPS